MLTHLIVATGLVLLFVMTTALSNARYLPQLGSQAANPFVLIAIFLALEFIDFSWLAADSAPMIRGLPIQATPDQISFAALYYIGMTLLLLSGAYFGLLTLATHVHDDPEPPAAERRSSLIAAVLFIVLALVMQAATGGLSLDVAGTSATKALRSQENPLIPMAQWAAVVAGGLYINCGRHTRGSVVRFGLLLLALAFATGVRTQQFIVIIFIMTALARLGIMYSRKWVLVLALPMLAALTMYRYFFRAASWYEGDFSSFVEDRGGTFGVLFASDEISFAEVYTQTLFFIHQGVIERLPFQSLLGLIMTPLPRAWLGDLKPLPAPAAFNLAIAPGAENWKAGLVVGPYFDLYHEFGLVGSFFAAFLYGLVMGVLIKMASRSKHLAYFWLGAASAGAFVYTRTDLQNLGQFIWPLAIVVTSWKLMTLAMRGRKQTHAFPVVS